MSLTIHHPEFRRLVRFGVVNAGATLLDLISVSLVRYVLHAPWFIAVATGFAANVTSGFVLNRMFVFDDGHASLRTATWRYGVLFAFNALVGIGGVTVLIDHGWPYIVARLTSSVFLVITNFIVSKLWVFEVRSVSREATEATEAAA
jgi:putative flippase GtrA